jgi:hypothetical protein
MFIQKAFPLLAKYPPDRIEFLTPINLPSNIPVAGQGVIMEEVWFKLLTTPPQVLQVQLRDGPKDEIARGFLPLQHQKSIPKLMIRSQKASPDDRATSLDHQAGEDLDGVQEVLPGGNNHYDLCTHCVVPFRLYRKIRPHWQSL